ncbi:MAG: hypothetical protein KJS90_02975 [Acidobacteria bacterium]|nr:hypothetical protein [Acidobacteriota bacterium]
MEDHGMDGNSTWREFTTEGDGQDFQGFTIVWKGDGDPDVLMRMRNDETGREITLLSAPATLFPDDGLGPLVTAFEDQVIVTFNDDKVEEMFDESIRVNGEVYGEAAAVMLPITMLIRLAMKAAEPYFGT